MKFKKIAATLYFLQQLFATCNKPDLLQDMFEGDW